MKHITPKELCDALLKSYHYDNGRVIFVLNECEYNEQTFLLTGIHEFKVTDEVIINIESIDNFKLQMVDKYDKIAQEVIKNG